MSDLIIASVLTGLVFFACSISIELGVSAAVLEVIAGVIAGNFFHIHTTNWLTFIASSGGILLTFLAGIEISPKLLKEKGKEMVVIGGLSTLVPAILAFCFVFFFAHWTLNASKIAAIAMSTTSVAVVYTVLVEAGIVKSDLGKVLMAATFVTDFGAVLALSVLFVKFSTATLLFFVFCVVLLTVGPKLIKFFFSRYKNKVIEPEMKMLFFIFFITQFFAEIGNIEAVLPVFILGLLSAEIFEEHEHLVKKLRTVGFAFITPFFFLNSGMKVSVMAVMQNLGMVFSLLGVKVLGKTIGVYPALRVLMPKTVRSERIFFTLIKCTGLTFGTIASVFGYTNHFVTKAQFSVLITVVILSAVVPTVIAQQFFNPSKLKKAELIAPGEGIEKVIEKKQRKKSSTRKK